MRMPAWGFFALVSYVPDPLGAHLDELRQSLPGVEFRQAHITILPPRPLRVPVEVATHHTREILDGFGAFEVELDNVRRFPSTNFLYLELAEGSTPIHDLHDALNTGDLSFAEPFEFHPHLTLGGPIENERVESVQAYAEHLWGLLQSQRRFTVSELAALWAAPGDEALAWQRLWVHSLRPDGARSARAGITGRTS